MLAVLKLPLRTFTFHLLISVLRLLLLLVEMTDVINSRLDQLELIDDHDHLDVLELLCSLLLLFILSPRFSLSEERPSVFSLF